MDWILSSKLKRTLSFLVGRYYDAIYREEEVVRYLLSI